MRSWSNLAPSTTALPACWTTVSATLRTVRVRLLLPPTSTALYTADLNHDIDRRNPLDPISNLTLILLLEVYGVLSNRIHESIIICRETENEGGKKKKGRGQRFRISVLFVSSSHVPCVSPSFLSPITITSLF